MAELDRLMRQQMIYGVPVTMTTTRRFNRGDAVVADETGTVRMTDVEESPYDLDFTTHNVRHAPDRPARPLFFNFGYQVGQYGDELFERVPIKKTRL